MLTSTEKSKIKDVLTDGLNINGNINFPYFLDAIRNTNDKVQVIESKITRMLYNQTIIEQKIDILIRLIESKKW